MSPRSRRILHGAPVPRVLAVLGAALLLLTGCSSAVPMEPAPDAESPECATVVVHLPSTVADQTQRETDAQGTGAWGSPNASVLLHCGVPVPGPTTLPCVTVNGVDWINDDSDAPRYRFTTFGRTPATEVVVDSDAVSGSTVLVDLAPAVSRIKATGACVGVQDLNLPSGNPGDAQTPAPPISPAPTLTPAP